MSSVLYDKPGPKARRRELIGSVIGLLVIAGILCLAISFAAERGVFQTDRWDVLYDPPRGQTAADVWRSVLVEGLGATLRAAAIAAPIALAIGLALAIWRRARLRVVSAPAVIIIELFRGLPVLLMMLFGLLGFGWTAFQAVIFGLVVYNMAIFAEILRAGLAALPRGQAEAAYAIGMSRFQALLLVELPQAIRTMMPSLVAQLVVLLKDSSLGFIVGYVELLRGIQRNASYFGEQYFIALTLLGGGVYLLINISLSQVAIRLQRRGSSRSAGKIDTKGAAAELPAGAVVLDTGAGRNV